MKKNKKQLHEALAVLLTKLSSARDNPWICMLMKSLGDNTSIVAQLKTTTPTT